MQLLYNKTYMLKNTYILLERNICAFNLFAMNVI